MFKEKIRLLSLLVLLLFTISLLFSKLLPIQLSLVGILFIFFLLLIISFILKRRHKKLSRRAWAIVLATILVIFSYFGTLEYRFRSLISGINRVEESFVVDIVSMSDDVFEDEQDLYQIELGILSDQNSEVGHVSAKEFSYTNELDIKFVEYDSYLDSIHALVNGNVDYIVLPQGYQSTFSSIEEIQTELELLHTNFQFTGTKEVIIENQSSDVLNLVLIGGDNPIQQNSTAGFNYDVIVVLSMNFKTHESRILSIPRDSYIYLTCTQKKDKITHSGWYGAECLTESLSKFLDIEINNYMLVDFKGLISLVDSVGGVWIDVESPIDEQDENRDFENMIHIDAGYQNLNGQEALAFLRHRKTLSTGAIARSENHQVFINAIIEQLASAGSLLRIGSIFSALEEAVLTNLSNEDMYVYYQKAIDSIAAEGVSSILPIPLNLEGSGALIYTPSFGMDLYYYVLDAESVSQVKGEIQSIQVID